MKYDSYSNTEKSENFIEYLKVLKYKNKEYIQKLQDIHDEGLKDDHIYKIITASLICNHIESYKHD